MALLAILFFRFGKATWHAITAINVTGFCLYLIAQLLLTSVLAYCWLLLLPKRNGPTQFCLLIWGRALRDAAGEFLPFSYAGGLVIGARAIALFGIPAADAAASTIVDVMVEAVAEILFIALGLLFLAYTEPETRLWLGACAVLAAALATIAGFVALHRSHGAVTFISRILNRLLGPALRRLSLAKGALNEIRARRVQIARAAILHFICAVAGGVVTWFGFHILAAPISLFGAISFEAVIHALLALGFFMPARIGVQEAAYLLLGAVYGVPPELAISLSLFRRARNFAISIPILLSWQFLEARRLAILPRKSRAKP
jgi:putative membrane protein